MGDSRSPSAGWSTRIWFCVGPSLVFGWTMTWAVRGDLRPVEEQIQNLFRATCLPSGTYAGRWYESQHSHVKEVFRL